MTEDFKPYIDRLRNSGLRPTKQRLAICKLLFDRNDTFHFTIENLKETIEKNKKYKISLATLYNTINAFKENGYLKEIFLKGNKNFFDTNTKDHHHFYDEDSGDLSDIDDKNIQIGKISNIPTGKIIKKVEVTVRLASDNHNHKKNK